MGGLRHAMPWTWVLMWIATLAIAGVPILAGFFSKDEILAGVFARAHGSTLAEASLFGIPGSVILYVIYAIGLISALLTAIYMTRMMLYTFHGPSRTGDAERPHLREAPMVMTLPLVVLGVLSFFGGWLNLPAITGAPGSHSGFLGPIGALHGWLDPVVHDATMIVTHGSEAHLSHATEYYLIGAAVAVGLIGIIFALVRLKPARLVPKREARPEEGFERVLVNKYYVDEFYDRTVVSPTVRTSRNLLWRGIDAGLIDGAMVNGSAWLARGMGWVGGMLQSGQTGTYAWVLVIGVLAVLGAFTFR